MPSGIAVAVRQETTGASKTVLSSDTALPTLRARMAGIGGVHGDHLYIKSLPVLVAARLFSPISTPKIGSDVTGGQSALLTTRLKY